MSIVVVGSIAFDTIKTPFGMRERSLGGAANYFSIAAKFFNKVCIVGVIGDDYPKEHLEYLSAQGIDIKGIEIVKGRSFQWHGEYGFDLNNAQTLKTELNVFEHFKPILPEHLKKISTVFLANIDPSLQIHVMQQMHKPKISALDTMNYWISKKRPELLKAMSLVDILFINDAEIRALTGEHNILKATRAATKMGTRIVIVKRGEYGSLLSFDNYIAFMPAYPLEDVFDPTGAGDTFAGGFLGYLSTLDGINAANLKRAMLYGTVMSSFVIEQFSFDRLIEIDKEAICQRKTELLKMIELVDL